MAPRLELQALLETFTPNVYFQPPENVQLIYPCIIYERDQRATIFAGDRPYRDVIRYSVTVVDRDPVSPILSELGKLPMCLFNRHYVAFNLNHDVYNLFF